MTAVLTAPADLPPPTSGNSLKLPQAAAELDVSIRTLGRWTAAKKLRVVRLPGGGGVRVPRSEIERIKRERAEELAAAEKVLSEPLEVTT